MLGTVPTASAQVLPPPPPGGSATVEVQEAGELLGRGAGVVVTTEVSCTPSPFPPVPIPLPSRFMVTVSLTQRAGNSLVDGGATASAACDGTSHTIELVVTAHDRPYKQREALAIATLFSDTDVAEIRVTKSRPA